MTDVLLNTLENGIRTISLNRPEKLNAVNRDVTAAVEQAFREANDDEDTRVIVFRGEGRAFCAGYDLDVFAESSGTNAGIQEMPWDPIKDFAFMKRNTDCFMSLWRSLVPVICKVHGYAIAGGSDIALCADLLVMADNAQLGYPPARVWGCPPTAMWVYRLGAERAKRLLFSGDLIDGRQAEAWGLGQAVPAADLDDEVERIAQRMATVPRNQLIMQKMMVNQALENMGLSSTQTLANFFDGITRHSPEGVNFKQRAEAMGWKQAVRERDEGTFDWTSNQLFGKSEDSKS